MDSMNSGSLYRTVCFTGHRHFEPGEDKTVLALLDSCVRELIEKHGATVFRAGGALGFDTMAAYTVLGYRLLYPGIKLELYLPCPGQTRGWKEEDVDSYKYIKEHADRVYVASPTYFAGCMHVRNRMLVNGSDLCVAYCRKRQGGTAYTVDYARRQYLELINLADNSWRSKL